MRAWTVRHLCVTRTNLGQRKHNEFRAFAYSCVKLAFHVRVLSNPYTVFRNAYCPFPCVRLFPVRTP